MSLKVQNLLKNLKSKPESYWQKRGDKMALGLFQKMASSVPAYKDFLTKNRVNPTQVKTILDFKSLPTIDKESYLKKYDLKDLCWGGNLIKGQWVFSATSGTTGEPFYFPRSEVQDRQYAQTAELYLITNFQIHKKSTLYINGFAMGAWIGGVFTYQALRHVVEGGKYNLSIISPGVNKTEILKALKKLGPQFDQIIIGGYPPFVKDTIDEGLAEGINLKKYNLKFIFSAESFSEGFRDYIIKHAGLKNEYLDTLNHYGTVDLGTMSYETPISIFLRRQAVKTPKFYESLFKQASRLPTLTQYSPDMFYFEEVDGNLLCSSQSGIPLVRYDLKDRGGITGFEESRKIFREHFPKFKNTQATKAVLPTVWKLPFVYVYERSDLVVSWSGANIYPEHIKLAHQHKDVTKYVSGKFAMHISSDKNHNPYLQIHTELKKTAKPNSELEKLIQNTILKTLLKVNSEFKSNHVASPNKNIPKVNLWEHESHPHFKLGGKQKWSIKT